MLDTAPLDDEKSCMLLVMRVLSIVPLNFKVRPSMRNGAAVADCSFCMRTMMVLADLA